MSRVVLGLLGLMLSFYASAETGVGEHEIVFGVSSNSTGPSPGRAMAAQAGARLFIDKFNKAGGVLGRTIKLVEYDDKYDPRLAAKNAEKLISEDKIFAFFQPYGSISVKAVEAVANRHDMLLIFPVASATYLSEPLKKNIFNIWPRSREEAETLADFAVAKGWKELSLISQADAGGYDQKNSMDRRLQQLKLKKINAVEQALGTSEFSNAVTSALANKPQALAIGIIGKAVPEIISRVLAAGQRPVFLCFSPVTSEDFPASVKDQTTGVYVALSVPLLTDTGFSIVKDYLDAAKAANVKPSPTGLAGYIQAKVLTLALEKAGRDLTTASLRTAFETGFQAQDIGGLKISFSPSDHQALHEVFLTKAVGDHLERVPSH